MYFEIIAVALFPLDFSPCNPSALRSNSGNIVCKGYSALLGITHVELIHLGLRKLDHHCSPLLRVASGA